MSNSGESMFEKLMKLPLFQGVSQEQLALMVEKFPFHFLKYVDREQIAAAGDNCDYLRFVVSGSVRLVITNASCRVSLEQQLEAPDVIGADCLFGLRTVYPFDVFAAGDCGVLQITKAHFVEMLQSNIVCLFNMLNMLSRNSQAPSFSFIMQDRGLVVERLATLVASLTTPNSTKIKLHFRQKDLCLLLGARRTSLVNALDELQQAGIADGSISSLKVFDREALAKIAKL